MLQVLCFSVLLVRVYGQKNQPLCPGKPFRLQPRVFRSRFSDPRVLGVLKLENSVIDPQRTPTLIHFALRIFSPHPVVYTTDSRHWP